jgi:hypothetical protein
VDSKQNCAACLLLVSWRTALYPISQNYHSHCCENLNYGVHNFRDWCCYLYFSCSSVMQRYMIVLEYLGRQQYNISRSRMDVLIFTSFYLESDHLCGLVVRVLGYISGGPGSIPGTNRKTKVVGLERGSLSLVSTTEQLLDRKVAAPV